MPSVAYLALGFLGLVVAASDCGGATFEMGSLDGSADATSGDDGQSSGSSGSASGATSSGASSSGHASSGGSASSGASSGASASGSSSGGGSGTSASSGSSSGRSSSGASSSSSSSSSSSGSNSSSGAGDGGGCVCTAGRSCCSGQCVNPANDPLNCGGCGIKCGPGTYCNGSCMPIPCSSGGSGCPTGQTCCGTSCCTSGQLCCEQSGPVGGGPPACYTPTPTQPTCPQGCAPLCVSDRNLKRDIEPVDEQTVLDRVAGMPVSTWSYKSDDPSVRHMGPMAQDFHAAFGLGKSDLTYDAIDAHGVELAAIKALYERLQRDEAMIERLERENLKLNDTSMCRP